MDILNLSLGSSVIEHSCDWTAELGDSTVQPHTDIGHDNGHPTAVNGEWDLTRNELLINERLEDAGRSHFATTFPENILVTEADTSTATIELWNIRAVPGSLLGDEKIKIFETVYDRLVDAGADSDCGWRFQLTRCRNQQNGHT